MTEEWSEVKICTVLNCQHNIRENEKFHFVKALCVTERRGTAALAFWGGVVCEKCFGEIQKRLPNCQHNWGLGEQIGQIFFDKTSLKEDPFASFCNSCFTKMLPELLKYLLPWNDFVTVALFEKIKPLPV